MDESQEKIRRQALPWDGDSVVQFYLEGHPSFPYREQFIQLFLEAYRSYLAGCPRASIIVAGEALLRATYDRLIQLRRTGRQLSIRRTRRPIPLNDQTPVDVLYTLTDEVSFCEAIRSVDEAAVYPEHVIKLLFAVKDLRNRAAHGELPLLDEWDPDDPRPPERLEELLWSGTFEFPEGYRFIPSKNGSEWFTFDLRNYKCGSLKPLRFEDRFAAIQYLLVLEAIARMRQGAPDVPNALANKSLNPTGNRPAS